MGKRIRYLSVGLVGGAAAAYFLDPQNGPRRQAEIRQRTGALKRRVSRQVARTSGLAIAEVEGKAQAAQHLSIARKSPSDQQLKDRVQAMLFRDPEIPKANLNVNVENGTVVLRGQVVSRQVRHQIEARAKRVPGVNELRNLIRIVESSRT